MNIKLPRDLAACVTRAVLWRVIPFCLMEALVVVLIVTLGDQLFGKTVHLAIRILFYAILVCIPFLITKFPFNLRDRTFRGVVLEVSMETSFHIGYAGSRPMSRGGMAMFRTSGHGATAMRLTIQCPDGKIIRQALPPPVHPHTPPAVGDEVFHLFGSDHVITIPTPADDHVHCAVCNDINAPDATVCRTCGRTIVK